MRLVVFSLGFLWIYWSMDVCCSDSDNGEECGEKTTHQVPRIQTRAVLVR